MQCNEFREHLFDFLTEDHSGAGEEARKHLSACSSCVTELNSLKGTMLLLDEWEAPADTSPYFMTRLRARVREEAQKESSRSWLFWIRKPALALTSVALVVVSISIFEGGRDGKQNASGPATVQTGSASAVKDLQYLDKEEDVLADFELLDDTADLQSQVSQ